MHGQDVSDFLQISGIPGGWAETTEQNRLLSFIVGNASSFRFKRDRMGMFQERILELSSKTTIQSAKC